VRRDSWASNAASANHEGSALDARAVALKTRVGLATLAALVLTALVAFTASTASGAPLVTEHLYDFGPDGTESTNFQRIGSVAVDQETGSVYVLDAPAGSLYKFEADGTPLDWGGTEAYISENEITGLAPNTEYYKAQVAVDSTSHIVYVTEQHAVRAFHEDGEPAEFTAGPGAGTSEIPGLGDLAGVAVDSTGSIYASDAAGTVSIFSSSGELLTSFSTSSSVGFSGNLAVGPGGTVYVAVSRFESDGGGVLRFTPDPYPVSGMTTYTAEPKLSGSAGSGYFTIGASVDPQTGEIYDLVTSNYYTWIRKYAADGAFMGSVGAAGEGNETPGAGQGVAVVGGGEKFQYYLGANEGGVSRVSVFGENIVEGPPSIESISVSDVTSTSATFGAKFNPNTAATSYRFEYGLGDCAVTGCSSVPLGGGEIPAGHRPVEVLEDVAGLEPGTTYHYRFVAQNSFGTEETLDRTFTTQSAAIGFRLPDSRAWEMVSPSDKHGARLLVRPGPIQAGLDGSSLTYQSFPSIEEDPAGSAKASSVLARRQADGSWRSKDIASPTAEVAGTAASAGAEFKMFNSDLSEAIVEPSTAMPLSVEASENTPYLRKNTEPATYTPLLTGKEPYANVPPGTEFGKQFGKQVDVLGASLDFDHFVLVSDVPLIDGGGGLARQLYEWSDGQILPVSVRPVSEGGANTSGVLGSGAGSARGAISTDGSRVFWSSGALYMRDMDAAETVRLDVVQADASGAGTPAATFQGASADGSVVFFTDTQQLTADASPGGADLYRCELPPGGPASGCATLTDISVPTEADGSAEVQGIAAAIGEDGAGIYFVARGVLDDAPNQRGDSAASGQPNLYLWQEGAGARYIATLAEEDKPVWGVKNGDPKGAAVNLAAEASPSLRYLAFNSQRGLTGYDSSDAASGEPVQEVYRYDAAADQLDCVSCNPTGGNPTGQSPGEEARVDPVGIWKDRLVAASLPEAFEANLSISLYRPRAVLDNGRVFFNAIDPLVAADSNGEWDVYQYEPTGMGDCTSATSGGSIVRSAGGCVGLISSGTAEEEAAFLDAGATGDDAFFLTSAKLSVLDEDQEVDVYDARVDGITATLDPISDCLGEACQPLAQAPHDPTPASAAFRGAGNVKSVKKRCPKGKHRVRRKGKVRCVAKHRGAKKRAVHRRAGGDRRAHR
jgi:hypothetical protein